MNKLQILQNYGPLLAALTAAMLEKKGTAEAGKDASGTVSAKLREYANATHADGVDTEEARKALIVALDGEGLTGGTVKGSGNHYAGFRAMLAEGLNIDTGNEGKPFTNADAQAFIASDSTKRIKALREAISAVVRNAGKKADGEKTDAGREARLKELAEMIGANTADYDAMLDELGQDDAQEAQAA